MKKICLTQPQKWGHHRWGWRWVVSHIERELHDPSGVEFFDWGDGIFRNGQAIEKPWMAILHNVITYPKPNPFNCKIHSLETLTNSDFFIDSLPHCQGLWTLSQRTAEFLRYKTGQPVTHLLHPAHNTILKYNHKLYLRNPRIFMMGQWMRKYISFYELDTSTPKYIVTSGEFNLYDGLHGSNDVNILPFMNSRQYDETLMNSVIFLDFYDVAACNTVLECIMATTPLLVRKSSSIVEYLGEDYPLFYETMSEACEKASNNDLIYSTHLYLAKMDKSKFSIGHFINRLKESLQ